MDAFSREDMGADRLDAASASPPPRHPVGERRHVEINAFPRIDGGFGG
jgi:hypothetical protein